MRWIPLVVLTAVVLVALRLVSRHLGPPAPGGARRTRHPLLRLHHRRPPGPNPFEVLRVQTRLGAVADEVRSLERDETVYARAHHLEATQSAYDALLAEACVLAGVATEPSERGDEHERFREEVELAARGWSW